MLWWRLRLTLSTKKSFEEIARTFLLWRRRNGFRPHDALGPSLRHLTLCVRRRLDIRRRFSRRHLRIGALAGIGAFFILAAEIASSIAY